MLESRLRPIADPAPAQQTFVIARLLFLRGLAVVCLIAFASLLFQIRGLIGEQGILPVGKFLAANYEALNWHAFTRLPTLFWLNHSDVALHIVCVVGMGFAVLLFLGLGQRISIVLIWFCYLSLVVVGQLFMAFQWDSLLLETLLFSFWFAPAMSRQGTHQPPNRLARWAVWFLLFKLMFLSGATKILSGDPSWRDLTALNYHYMTQPLPNPFSWYMAQLPSWFHHASVVAMFVIELVVPILIFGPRHFRHVAALCLIGLQLMIGLTGNYGFFNLLTIVLCLPLIDDQMFSWLLPRRLYRRWYRSWTPSVPSRIRAVSRTLILTGMLIVSGLVFLGTLTDTSHPQKLPGWVLATQEFSDRQVMPAARRYLLNPLRPFRSISGYGLFRVMTTERPEIIIEFSEDGENWKPMEFVYKPGDPSRRLPVAGFHLPRLDWQMWFAALDPSGQKWTRALCQRLLENAPPTMRLLGMNPGHPQFSRIRLAIYQYEFTSPEDSQGNWWKRSRQATTGEIVLQDFR